MAIALLALVAIRLVPAPEGVQRYAPSRGLSREGWATERLLQLSNGLMPPYRSNAASISRAGSSGASDRFVRIATTKRESRSRPNTAVPPTAPPPWNAQRCPRLSVLRNH